MMGKRRRWRTGWRFLDIDDVTGMGRKRRWNEKHELKVDRWMFAKKRAIERSQISADHKFHVVRQTQPKPPSADKTVTCILRNEPW
jgi:hypothetical protein